MQQRTNREDLFLHLGRLEGKVDAILSNQTEQKKRIESIEVRVSKLENYKSYLIGISATIGALVTWLIDFIKGGHYAGKL
jgi:hypothetical protein